MNKVPLLSNRFKKVGWVLLIVAILFRIADSVLDIDSEIFTFNVLSIVSATGLEEGVGLLCIKRILVTPSSHVYLLAVDY